MLGEVNFQIIRFQCKDDLLKQLPDRLRGYQSWLLLNWAIIVLIDRDGHDCSILKQELENIAAKAGLVTKPDTVLAILLASPIVAAIEELEAWYFGDWPAVHRLSARIRHRAAESIVSVTLMPFLAERGKRSERNLSERFQSNA